MANKQPKPPVKISPMARVRALLDQAKIWTEKNPQQAKVLIGIMLIGVPVCGTVLLTMAKQRPPKVAPVAPVVKIEEALEAYDAGDFRKARKLADKLRLVQPRPIPPSGPSFIHGAIAAQEADEFWGKDRKRYATLASKYLEEARSLGFPEDRVGEGLFLLGKSLATAGRLKDSRPILEEALQQDGVDSAEIHRLLSIAYRNGESPDPRRALEHISLYVQDESLDDATLWNGRLAEGELLWQLQEFERCGQVVEQIPPSASVFAQATTLRGRLLMDEARKLKQGLTPTDGPEPRLAVTHKYEEAIAVLRKAQIDPFDSEAVRKSMYLIGVCFLEMEDYRAALTQFIRTRDVYLDTPEGLSSGLQEADLLRDMDRHDDALAAYVRVLDAVGDPAEFVNSWIPLEEFRERIISAERYYSAAGQFERAIEIANHLSPLVSKARAIELSAEAHRQWARQLISQADTLTEPKASEARQQGRSLMRQAGRIYSELAQLEFSTRRYPDDLWQAAQCYLDGQDFSASVSAFEDYMKNELKARRPLALVGMGQALLALQRFDDALTSLNECVEYYGQDASSYKARWMAARAYIEKDDLESAEKLLRQNLNGEHLTPASKEWRDSLFTLGDLLASAGRYDEAIKTLEEAVNRYPDTREAISARYLIAESYCEAARAPQEKLLTDTIETTRAAHRRQIQQYLNSAIQYYEQVQLSLNRRQETMELSALEKANLRNSYFAIGAALFDLGRFEESIRAYSTATNRYQHDPEALEAFVQIASCYRRLNKPQEARGTIQQAKIVMNRIPENADFALATNYSRREWVELLDWLSTL